MRILHFHGTQIMAWKDNGETSSGSNQPVREVRDSTPPPVFTHKDPRTLKPHQKNSAIYGESEDATELIELIRISGWVKPLVVTPTGTIISGHQRCKAVLALGWESILVEVREFPDELAELEALLLENASRLKTTEQKVREGEAWKEVEETRARLRIIAAQNNNSGRAAVQNFAQLLTSKGKTRDRIAHRVGLGSGYTYAKAAKVVTQIDSDTSVGHTEVAQVLRKTLNEQSVDAAHALLLKTPEELTHIANLITNGFAKSIKQAVKMINLNNSSGDNNAADTDPSKPSLAGVSVGDWVEVSDQAHAHNKTYIGQRGRIEQVLAASQQISVKLEDVTDKLRFDACELSLLVRAAPQNPIQIGDIVFVRIDRHEAASIQEKKWNGYWGKVTQLGEMGSLSVDVGKGSLQLFPRDIKPIDALDSEMRQVVERVLHLRRLELDEVEERMLDVFQRREWLTSRQMDYLNFMSKCYHSADLLKTENHQVVQFRSR